MAANNGFQMPSGSLHSDYTSPTPPKQQDANPAAHQRTYQGKLCNILASDEVVLRCDVTACIPCRNRKVRCDLGPLDNPHLPPCVRCKRESKDCYFSNTRRKKKGDVADGSGDGEESVVGFEIKGGRKRLRATPSHNNEAVYEDDDDYDDLPRTPGGSIARMQPLRRPQVRIPIPKPFTRLADRDIMSRLSRLSSMAPKMSKRVQRRQPFCRLQRFTVATMPSRSCMKLLPAEGRAAVRQITDRASLAPARHLFLLRQARS